MPPRTAPSGGTAGPGLRIRWRSWVGRVTAEQVRRWLLVAVAIFELLAILIIIVLNVGGAQSGTDKVMAPDTYLLQWNKSRRLNDSSGTKQTETYKLYWFLNGLCIEDPLVGSLQMQSRSPGTDFDWRWLDDQLNEYIDSKYGCNSTSEGSAVNGTSSNATRCVPPTDTDDPPPQLSRQPYFGRSTFILYIMDIVVIAAAWPWLLWLEGDQRWQKYGRLALLFTKSAAGFINVTAAGLLTTGIGWVVHHSKPNDNNQEGFANATYGDIPSASAFMGRRTTSSSSKVSIPIVNQGLVGFNLVWIAVISQLLACGLFAMTNKLLSRIHNSQGRRLGSRGEENNASMYQRPGSLPFYRPRDSGARRRGEYGEDDEDLPAYERHDPLGRPPSIEGYTHDNGCNIAYSGSASTANSGGGAGPDQSLTPHPLRQSRSISPSPEYRETEIVEPVSLIGENSLAGENILNGSTERSPLDNASDNDSNSNNSASSSRDGESSIRTATSETSTSSLVPSPVPSNALSPQCPAPAQLSRGDQ